MDCGGAIHLSPMARTRCLTVVGNDGATKASLLKAHRTASSFGIRKGAWPPDWPNQGGMNTKRLAICDSHGRPLNLFVTAGQVSDYIGAKALLSGLPNIDWLLGDRGDDADWFRVALEDKGKHPASLAESNARQLSDTSGARGSSCQPSHSRQSQSIAYEPAPKMVAIQTRNALLSFG